MDSKKQKLLIEYLISSTDTFAICEGIVDPDYFDPEYRNALHFIKKYYNDYNTTPSPVQIDAETGVELILQDILPDHLSYTTKEIEKYCQDRALEKAVLQAPKLIAENNREQLAEDVKNAISEMEFFEVFSGTWVNEDYSGMFNWLQKVVFFPMADGKNIILLQTTSLTIMGNTQWMTCG